MHIESAQMPTTAVETRTHTNTQYRGLSARLQWLQCVSNGVTVVLHWAINMIVIVPTAAFVFDAIGKYRPEF